MGKKLKILVVRFSSIGDIVLTTPVVRCLKQQLDAEVHFLTKPSFESLLLGNPYIDELHLLKEDLKDTIAELKAIGFDHLVDLHHNLRTGRLKSGLTGVPSTSFYKMNWEKWLAVNFGIDRLQDRHIVDRYMDTVKHLGVVNDGKGLDHFIPEKDQLDSKAELPEQFHKGYVAYAIGGNHAYKRLPKDKIIEICRQLDIPVVLLGGPEDESVADNIVKAVGLSVFNACSRYSINGSASLMQQAKAVIAHDTGLMHIAAAQKQRVISIWGATTPSLGMYPYLPGEDSKMIEPKGGSRRPYSKLGDHKWYKGQFTGFDHLDTDDVVKAVNAVL